MTKSAPARFWIALAVRICPAPGTWPAAPAGHRSEAREATPVVRWLQVPVEGAHLRPRAAPRRPGEARRCGTVSLAPCSDGWPAGIGSRSRPPIAAWLAGCPARASLVRHGAARGSAAPPPRCSAACAPGQAGFGARGGLPWQRPARALPGGQPCTEVPADSPAGTPARRAAAQPCPPGVSTAKAGPPVRRASLSTTGLTGPAEHRRWPSSLISSPRPGAACCWSARTAAPKSASKPFSSHDHSPACLATALPARPCQAPRPVLQQTLSEPAASSAATVPNRAAQGAE
jgi:hypothetical protein